MKLSEGYTITRQIQWPEGIPVVEISEGGIDYTNPDALYGKYPGEFDTFMDPREAVETAIRICRAWRQDGKKNAKIGIGATMGMTIPFESCKFNDAKVWAKKTYEILSKCSYCGGILSEKYFTCFYDSDSWYCSEQCAERAWRNPSKKLIEEELEQMQKLDKVEDEE